MLAGTRVDKDDFTQYIKTTENLATLYRNFRKYSNVRLQCNIRTGNAKWFAFPSVFYMFCSAHSSTASMWYSVLILCLEWECLDICLQCPWLSLCSQCPECLCTYKCNFILLGLILQSLSFLKGMSHVTAALLGQEQKYCSCVERLPEKLKT